MVLALFSFVVLASCNTKKKLTPEMLMNHSWELTTLNGTAISYAENERPVQFNLTEKDNKVSGFAGCNNFMGTYTLKGDTLTFAPLATTRKACPDADINEADVLKAFSEVATVSLENGKLSFLNAKKEVVAVFAKIEKKKAEEAATLTDAKTPEIVEKYWKLKTLNGEAVTMAENQQKENYFMLKAKDTQVRGFAGCNTFNGTYTLENKNQISFEKMATTMKACPDLEINESEFLSVFGAATSYTLNDDQLVLKNEKQDALASFEAVYF